MVQEIVHVDPNALIPDPNVRRHEGDLRGLAATIREFGVLEPLGVRKGPDGYHLVYGNRRRAAAILAGVQTVPCVVLEARAEDDYVIHQIVENLQRRDLSDMEQAEGFALIRRRLVHREPALSEREIDERISRLVGLSARTISRYLALRELPAEVRDLIQDEELSVSQAQHLHQIPQAARQVELAQAAVEYDLSAAAIRDAAVLMTQRRSLTALEAISAPGRIQPMPVEEEEEFEEIPVIEPSVPVVPVETPRPRLIRTFGVFDDEIERMSRSIRNGGLDRAIKRDPRRLETAIQSLRVLLADLEHKLEERAAGAA